MSVSKSKDELLMRQADQIHTMKVDQMNGLDKLPTVEANRNPKYQIRTDEADGYVHVRVCNKHYQSTTKSITREERILTIHKAQFQAKIDEKYFATYDEVEVIHDPRANAPKTYELGQKEGVVKLDTPNQKETGNAQLNERVKALKEKEKSLTDKEAELIAKQTELEQREAKLHETTIADLAPEPKSKQSKS
jgi:hypothetical protein